MELATFVSLRVSLGVFSLAGAVLTKVFGSFGRDVGEELHLHTAQGFTYLMVRKRGGVRHGSTLLIETVENKMTRNRRLEQTCYQTLIYSVIFLENVKWSLQNKTVEVS